MDSQRYLRCLGQPALFAPNGEPIRFRTKKHLALLVYLAVENRSHRRDRLAELLWPKVSATEARHSLATALSVLRPRLGLEGLEASRDHARLTPGRVVLDLERLQSGDVLGSEVTEPLQVAAFLDGFDIVDSAEFTLWKDQQQARLLPIIKDALLVLIDRCRRTGDTRQIEQLADRMLALDYLCEDAIRAKMEARAFAGDRLTALEIFEGWKRKLAEELHAAPSDLVEGMAVRLRRRGLERTTLRNIPNVPTDHWRGRPFIGRTQEYRVLYEAWEGISAGISGHALILGDSGVGKTTLVQRLTTAAGLEGAAISRVQCYDVERGIPYSTLSGLITGLLDSPGVSATSPESLAELSRVVAQVRQRFPNLPEPNDTRGEAARIRLTEAFLEMLTVISEDHPVVLVVDDLHVADDISLAVLHVTMRRARKSPIMIILVTRPGELNDAPQAVRLRQSSNHLGIREIELYPLEYEESREMLLSLIEPDEMRPTQAEERALLRASGGYPMVLELLVQDWKTNPQGSLALGLDAMTADLNAKGSADSAYHQILDRISRSVDSTTNNVLKLAAILGRRLNDLGMYAIVDLTTGQTMTAMAELVKRRVLRDGPQGLEFVNELLRAAVYLGIPQTLRRVIHSNIADRFLQRQPHDYNNLSLEIAWHCMRAGRIPEGTRHLLQGARDSVGNGSLHGAERALSTAIPHLEGAQRGDAILLLVEVLQEQGRWRESLDILRASATEHSSQASLVFSVSAQFWSEGCSFDDSRTHLAGLAQVIDSPIDPRLRVRAAKVAATLISNLREPELARSILRSIDTIPVPVGGDDLARLADCKAQLLYYALEPGLCSKEISRVMEQLADQQLTNSTVASLRLGLGIISCADGRYLEAKAEFRRAYDIGMSLGNDTIAGSRAAQIALCCCRLGEYKEALEWNAAASRFVSEMTFGGYVECQIAQVSGLCHALLGEIESALRAIAGCESRLPESTPAWMKQYWSLHKADILYCCGLRAEAFDTAGSALGTVPVLYEPSLAGPFARWLGLTARNSRSYEAGKRQLEALTRDLPKYDALDQVEILCGLLLTYRAPDREFLDLVRNIHERLSGMAPAISEQLFLLDILPTIHQLITRNPELESLGLFTLPPHQLGATF